MPPVGAAVNPMLRDKRQDWMLGRANGDSLTIIQDNKTTLPPVNVN